MQYARIKIQLSNEGVNALNNRYCLFCGTLLPEDGVCLRCGAKYELADNGQLVVSRRKVKNVFAKASPKTKNVDRKTARYSEADTQTIPIPVDIFSLSEELNQEDKHNDWTNRGNVAKEKGKESHIRSKSTHEKQRKRDNKRRTVVLIIAILAVLLAAVVLFSSIDKNGSEKNKNEISTNVPTTTTTQITSTDNQGFVFPELSLRCYQGNDFSQGFYSYDSNRKMLSVRDNGHDPISFFLLPLIDNQNNKNNPLLPLCIIELIGDPCIPLVFSDLVKEGHIKSIMISSNEYSDQQAVYEMVVKNGLVQQASYRFTSKEEDPVGNSEYYENTKCQYEYDANNRLVSETVISLDDTNRQYEQELYFEYESDGGLKSVHGTYHVVNEGFDGVINTELKKHNDNKISSISFISDEEAPPVGADYTYNEEGYVRRLEMHESPSTYVFNYDQNSRIVSVTYMGQ